MTPQHVYDDLAIGDVEAAALVARIDHLVAGRSQMRAEVRTHEAGRAGDERLHADAGLVTMARS